MGEQCDQDVPMGEFRCRCCGRRAVPAGLLNVALGLALWVGIGAMLAQLLAGLLAGPT